MRSMSKFRGSAALHVDHPLAALSRCFVMRRRVPDVAWGSPAGRHRLGLPEAACLHGIQAALQLSALTFDPRPLASPGGGSATSGVIRSDAVPASTIPTVRSHIGVSGGRQSQTERGFLRMHSQAARRAFSEVTYYTPHSGPMPLACSRLAGTCPSSETGLDFGQTLSLPCPVRPDALASCPCMRRMHIPGVCGVCKSPAPSCRSARASMCVCCTRSVHAWPGPRVCMHCAGSARGSAGRCAHHAGGKLLSAVGRRAGPPSTSGPLIDVRRDQSLSACGRHAFSEAVRSLPAHAAVKSLGPDFATQTSAGGSIDSWH